MVAASSSAAAASPSDCPVSSSASLVVPARAVPLSFFQLRCYMDPSLPARSPPPPCADDKQADDGVDSCSPYTVWMQFLSIGGCESFKVNPEVRLMVVLDSDVHLANRHHAIDIAAAASNNRTDSLLSRLTLASQYSIPVMSFSAFSLAVAARFSNFCADQRIEFLGCLTDEKSYHPRIFLQSVGYRGCAQQLSTFPMMQINGTKLKRYNPLLLSAPTPLYTDPMINWAHDAHGSAFSSRQLMYISASSTASSVRSRTARGVHRRLMPAENYHHHSPTDVRCKVKEVATGVEWLCKVCERMITESMPVVSKWEE